MRSIFLLLITSLVFASCTEVIDIDAPQGDNKLVVEGVISSETDSSYVKLTRSIDYFSNDKIPMVSNASVEVNGVPFTYVSDGIYRPVASYQGQINTVYNLKITYDGKEYTSSSRLDPMYDIDSMVPTFKERKGFFDEGYTVTIWSTDRRTPIKYTIFLFGFKNADTRGKDSLFDESVLFDNSNSKLNETIPFEIPFMRLAKKDTAVIIFKSCDLLTFNFFNAAANSGGGGPFSSPPANLPTNIKGGGLGIFSAYDVKRFRVRI